jgi:hypothetical protein
LQQLAESIGELFCRAPTLPVNRALTTLKKLFHHAEKCGYGVCNPTRGIEFLNEGPGRMRVVSFAEEIAYFAKTSQPLRDIAQIIWDTGLRPDEVFRIPLRTSILGRARSSTLSAILGHTSIQMTMRYLHPAEEQKRFAAGKLELFRIAGIMEAMEKGRQVTTVSATVQ